MTLAALIIGLIVGGAVGMFIMALACAGGRSDRELKKGGWKDGND